MPAEITAAQTLAADATMKDFQFSPGKAGQFLSRVQSQISKATKSHGGNIVARMEISGIGAAPIYRLERENGKVLAVINGVGHKALAHDTTSDRAWTWSTATMSFNYVSDAALLAFSDEIRKLQLSNPKAR